METFADTERLILEKTKQCYKWIARDKDGELCIYETKPFRDEVAELFDTEFGDGYMPVTCFSDNVFNDVTWENSPIQYRNSEPLMPKESEYLKLVFRPFASDIAYVLKNITDNSEFIGAYLRRGEKTTSIMFPEFKKGTMYKGMKPEVPYTLKELGIEYNE